MDEITKELFDDMVYKINKALTKMWNKTWRDAKIKPKEKDFTEAVLFALKEGFKIPKHPGGQPGNSNAKKVKVSLVQD